VWLTDLTAMAGVEHSLTAASTGTASTEEETTRWAAAIGFIQFLESAKGVSAAARNRHRTRWRWTRRRYRWASSRSSC
jgi:Smg protein